MIAAAVPAETVVSTVAWWPPVAASPSGCCSQPPAVDAVLGNNIAYWLGRSFGGPVARQLFRSEHALGRLEWAERAVGRHGATLVLVGRYVPGGRTVSTFAAETLSMPWRRFVIADTVAAVTWAVYATMLGYLGGATFSGSAWKSLALALGLAAAFTLSVEIWRRVERHRGRDLLGDPLE